MGPPGRNENQIAHLMGARGQNNERVPKRGASPEHLSEKRPQEKWPMGPPDRNENKIPSLMGARAQENERIPKRGASPQHLSDKRPRGDNRGNSGFKERDSIAEKTPDIADQLQQMLQQLVNAQGSKPLSPASSSQQSLLEEIVEKTAHGNPTADYRSQHGRHQHTGESGSSSDPSMNQPATADTLPGVRDPF